MVELRSITPLRNSLISQPIKNFKRFFPTNSLLADHNFAVEARTMLSTSISGDLPLRKPLV